MKFNFALVGAVAAAGLVSLAAPVTAAKDHPIYQSAVLLSMQSAKCGVTQKDGKSITGEILGTDADKRQASDVLCQEYVLQADRVIYHIRPADEKHAALLPVGDEVRFRIQKTKFFVFDPQRDKKERAYTVVSMEPRQQNEVAKNAPESR
jgi:hypothetical protein